MVVATTGIISTALLYNNSVENKMGDEWSQTDTRYGSRETADSKTRPAGSTIFLLIDQDNIAQQNPLSVHLMSAVSLTVLVDSSASNQAARGLSGSHS